MNRVFVDTSAILALLVPTDQSRAQAVEIFDRLHARESSLITTSYVLVETYALLSRRFGRQATGAFRSDFAPLLDVIWVDRELHERGLDVMLDRPTGVSLVDAVSLIAIREHDVDGAFVFDRHFDDEGLHVLV